MLYQLTDLIGFDVISRSGVKAQCFDILFDCQNFDLIELEVVNNAWSTHQYTYIALDEVISIDWVRERIILSDLYEGPFCSHSQKREASDNWCVENLNQNLLQGSQTLFSQNQISPDESDKCKVTGRVWSLKAVIGSDIEALDGPFGALRDLLVDDSEMKIQYWLVALSRWWFGGLRLVPSKVISSFHSRTGALSVFVKKEKIASSPKLPIINNLAKTDEENILNHYGTLQIWRSDNQHLSSLVVL